MSCCIFMSGYYISLTYYSTLRDIISLEAQLQKLFYDFFLIQFIFPERLPSSVSQLLDSDRSLTEISRYKY